MRFSLRRVPTKRRSCLTIMKTFNFSYTDINVPGTVDGLKLAAAVKARRPEMNIIITTGYSAPKDEEIPQGSLFLPKPYNARKMIEAVRHFQ